MTATASAVTLTKGFPFEFSKRLWAWLNDPRDPNFDDFGIKKYEDFLNDLVRRIRTEHVWTILEDGEFVGYVAAMRSNEIACTLHGMILKPSARGRGIGTRAMECVLNELNMLGYKCIVSTVFWDNAPIIGVLKKCQFREVGMLQNATMRNGNLEPMRIMQHKGCE